MSKLPAKPPRPEALKEFDRLLQLIHVAPHDALEKSRQYVEQRLAKECPPLLPMDIVGVLAIEWYELLYRKQIPGAGRIRTSEIQMFELVALEHVIVTAPELAAEAGLLPALEVAPEDRVAFSYGQFMRWQRDVSNPAQMSLQARFFRPNLELREDRIALAVLSAGFRGTHDGNGRAVRFALEHALTSLRVREGGDPPLSRTDVFLHMKAFVDHPLSAGDLLFRGRDGHDRLGWRQLRTELKGALRESGELQAGTRPGEQSCGDLSGMASGAGSARLQQGPRTVDSDSDDVESLRRMRELRDQLDRHPAIKELLEKSKVAGEPAVRILNEIRPLADLLDRRDDPARKAAILYLWFDGHAGSVPGGRERVARIFGVTPKRLRDRESAARGDLATLSRRSG
jgi:hypothetical protein